MIWYVGLFALIAIVAVMIERYKDTKLKTFLEKLVLLILVLFSGTRNRLGGYDYGIY